jgi:small GTP-binding protein
LENQAILKSIEQIGDSQYSAKIKCVLLGAAGVGKTSFKSRFLWDEFKTAQDPTMGASRHITTRSIANISLNIELWDTGNIERYNSFVPIYLEGCACVIIVYDITDQETFYRATSLLKSVKKAVPGDTIIILVGNKADIDNRRQQGGEEAVDAIKGQCYFYEMSCKENRNVHHPLHLLACMIDGMVESLVQKRVPIPRAKPRLADATPSSVLSRSNEMRAEAKAKAKAAAAAEAAAAEGKEEKGVKDEKDIDHDGKDIKNGRDDKDEKDSDDGKSEGVVAVGPSSNSPRPPRAVVGEWWENSPYIKKAGDEYVFSCAERLAKTSECVSVELTVTKTAIILENVPVTSSFSLAPVEGLFRFLSRREYNFLAKGCVIKVSEDTHHPQRLEIWIKRKPFGGLLENAEIYEEDICVLACPLRTQLLKILKAQLPPTTVFGTNSHSITRSDFIQVYREHCKFMRATPYRPIEDQILLDSARSDEPFTRLDMSRVLRESKHLLSVLEGLRWNASVQHLDLSINNLGLSGLTSVCRITHTMYTITSLDLSDNKLGKESIPYLVGLLSTLPTLRVLLLDSNGISDVAPIGVNLYTNTTLTTLGLSHNNITSDSILTFARALVINTTLVSLDLSSNLLTEEVSMPLLNALSCNTNLTRLCVLGNAELHKDTILHLTLPKSGNQTSKQLTSKREDEIDNGTVGNAGTPLDTNIFNEICEKCKLEQLARRKYATQAPVICTHMAPS